MPDRIGQTHPEFRGPTPVELKKAGNTRVRIWCNRHARGRRKLRAVITVDGWLRTNSEKVPWPSPGTETVPAPCNHCATGCGARKIDIAKLHAAIRAGETDPIFEDVAAA